MDSTAALMPSIAIGDMPAGADTFSNEWVPAAPRRLTSRLGERKWPVLIAVIMLAVGMAFMLCWEPVVHHTQVWYTGSDLWGMFRAAHYVGWGFIGGVYTPTNGVIAFPGMPVLLAPIAMLSGRLDLSESDTLMLLAHPSAALILQPVELLLDSVVVFAVDALAERLAVPRLRRLALCIATGAIAWPIAAMWGHAEDSLAMAFLLYAVIALLDRRWNRCGWLLGIAVVFQPLAALAVPLIVGATPRGQRVALAIRSAVLSAFLVGVAFIGDPGDTFRMLVKQPTQPSVNHATPWAALAPEVPSSTIVAQPHPSPAAMRGYSFHRVPTPHSLVAVAGGPGRIIDVIVALAVGLYVWRRPQYPLRFLWLVAAVLASRCFFEAVMTPYYIAPPLILGLVLAARKGRVPFLTVSIIAGVLTYFSYLHLGPWLWWAPIIVGLGIILALGFPLDGPVPTRRPPTGLFSDRFWNKPAPSGEGPESLARDGPAALPQPVAVGHGRG